MLGRLTVFMSLASLLAANAAADWPTDLSANLPVRVAPGTQEYVGITSDGAGGAIIAWRDGNSSTGRMRARRVRDGGILAWDSSMVVCASLGIVPSLVSDAAGGAIIVSGNHANESLFFAQAQRIDSVGTIQWTYNLGYGANPDVASDGAGGAFLAWVKYHSPGTNVYLQHFDGAGARWGSGVNLNPSPGQSIYQLEPAVVADGAGGAIAAWRNEDDSVLVQRVNSTGQLQWGPSGITLSRSITAEDPKILSDGSGGAIVAWGNGGFIDAQRVDASGTPQWTPGGVSAASSVLFSDGMTSKGSIQLISDGAGGVIVGYQKNGSNSRPAVFAQHIDLNGIKKWGGGVVVTGDVAIGDMTYEVAPDGVGGAVFAFTDRNGTVNVFGQRLTPTGVRMWGDTRRPISAAAGDELSPAFVFSGPQELIVAWHDTRNEPSSGDIYAQHFSLNDPIVSVDPSPGLPTPTFSVHPNPFSSSINMSVIVPRPGQLRADLVDVGGRTVARTSWSVASGRNALSWDLGHVGPPRSPPGIYFLRLSSPGWSVVSRMVRVR